MLQIVHRTRYDIEIFLTDPQLPGFVAASVAVVEPYLPVAHYSSDGSLYL